MKQDPIRLFSAAHIMHEKEKGSNIRKSVSALAETERSGMQSMPSGRMEILSEFWLEPCDIQDGKRRQAAVKQHQAEKHHQEEHNRHDRSHFLEIGHNSRDAKHEREEDVHENEGYREATELQEQLFPFGSEPLNAPFDDRIIAKEKVKKREFLIKPENQNQEG